MNGKMVILAAALVLGGISVGVPTGVAPCIGMGGDSQCVGWGYGGDGDWCFGSSNDECLGVNIPYETWPKVPPLP